MHLLTPPSDGRVGARRGRRPAPSRVVLLVVAALVCGCGRAGPSATPDTGPPGAATVTRVVDGDTVVVDLGGRQEKVRFIGVDTPETKSPTKPVQCFGKEASAHTDELLPAGTAVRLERDVEERDTYGRLLAYLYRLGDGLFVNLDLARGGFADTLRIAPNVAHADELQAAVDDAHRRGSGLWGTCGGPGRPAP
jgi:micrococcal nuclease